jgi:hypothetical protein
MGVTNVLHLLERSVLGGIHNVSRVLCNGSALFFSFCAQQEQVGLYVNRILSVEAECTFAQ